MGTPGQMRPKRIQRKCKLAPVVCEGPGCDVEFTPTRRWQKYHDPACRRAAHRSEDKPGVRAQTRGAMTVYFCRGCESSWGMTDTPIYCPNCGRFIEHIEGD